MVSMSAAINGGSLQAMEYCQSSDGLSRTKDVAMIAVTLRVCLKSTMKVQMVTMLAHTALIATRVKLVGKLSHSPMAMSAGYPGVRTVMGWAVTSSGPKPREMARPADT